MRYLIRTLKNGESALFECEQRCQAEMYYANVPTAEMYERVGEKYVLIRSKNLNHINADEEMVEIFALSY